MQRSESPLAPGTFVAYASLAAAFGAVPVPFLGERISDAARRSAFRRLGEERGVAIEERALAIVAEEPERGWLTRWLGKGGSALFPVVKIPSRLVGVMTLSVELALFARYLERREAREPLLATEAADLRRALDAVGANVVRDALSALPRAKAGAALSTPSRWLDRGVTWAFDLLANAPHVVWTDAVRRFDELMDARAGGPA